MRNSQYGAIEKFLKEVRKPGRYLGNEYNVIKKSNAGIDLKFALAFPDLYEIGMSHLGMQILYGLLNKDQRILCERVFQPGLDFEDKLRENNLPLCSLESKTPINEFDIIGFSLQYELSYPTVINMLDLARIPVWSEERKSFFPLIVAGGPCTSNPEPIADFIDFFVIGDGEELLPQIADILIDFKKEKRAGHSKSDFLKTISKLKGIYVPSFYNVSYLSDTRIKEIRSSVEEAPRSIQKEVVKDYSGAFYPDRPLVANIETVHDRANVEIMRGCPRQCKFCQARAFYYPPRKRDPERVKCLITEIVNNTGYEEASLVSLSSGDYPHIEELLSELVQIFGENRTSLSLPSLRVEKLIEALPFYTSKIRKTGLTFAPEAGSERLRREIGKNIDIENLKRACEEAFKNGYNKIKLYFMIGLPTEKFEDLNEIVDLVYEISRLRLKHERQPAQINLTLSTFIPKPHTFYEREGMDNKETILEKQEYLRGKLKAKYIKREFSAPYLSFIEAALARGSRKLSRIIWSVWSKGSRLDSWNEHFEEERWKQAFDDEGIDLENYAIRRFDDNEILPWSHIDLGNVNLALKQTNITG